MVLKSPFWRQETGLFSISVRAVCCDPNGFDDLTCKLGSFSEVQLLAQIIKLPWLLVQKRPVPDGMLRAQPVAFFDLKSNDDIQFSKRLVKAFSQHFDAQLLLVRIFLSLKHRDRI